MPFFHKSISPELEEIADTGPYGRQIADAIDGISLCFQDAAYFVRLGAVLFPGIEKVDVNAVFTFDKGPKKKDLSSSMAI